MNKINFDINLNEKKVYKFRLLNKLFYSSFTRIYLKKVLLKFFTYKFLNKTSSLLVKFLSKKNIVNNKDKSLYIDTKFQKILNKERVYFKQIMK